MKKEINRLINFRKPDKFSAIYTVQIPDFIF